jgi:hypothetical protein
LPNRSEAGRRLQGGGMFLARVYNGTM